MMQDRLTPHLVDDTGLTGHALLSVRGGKGKLHFRLVTNPFSREPPRPAWHSHKGLADTKSS